MLPSERKADETQRRRADSSFAETTSPVGGAKGIDPEVLKQISVFGFQDFNPQCPNDTSTESP
jgi:hypothetical protein